MALFEINASRVVSELKQGSIDRTFFVPLFEKFVNWLKPEPSGLIEYISLQFTPLVPILGSYPLK